MKTVITYGTFDLFHIGHVRILRAARTMGDRLVVGVSTDEFNDLKGKKSIFTYEERREILESCKWVDEVFAEECWEQKQRDIRRYNAKIFVMGDDWEGKFDHLRGDCVVRYVPRTQEISTSLLKNNLIHYSKVI